MPLEDERDQTINGVGEKIFAALAQVAAASQRALSDAPSGISTGVLANPANPMVGVDRAEREISAINSRIYSARAKENNWAARNSAEVLLVLMPYKPHQNHHVGNPKSKERTMRTERAELYFRQGNSDKVYHLQLENVQERWTVQAQWGRRGSALQSDAKADGVPFEEAKRVYDRILREKTVKGYQIAQASTNGDVPISVADKYFVSVKLATFRRRITGIDAQMRRRRSYP
jgi:predicted DNA-binding WGR domain protein